MPEISIINTKSANFHSVKKAIDLYNPGTLVTSSQQEIKNSKGIIIPGVSSTDTVLQNLSQLKLDKVILDFYNFLFITWWMSYFLERTLGTC